MLRLLRFPLAYRNSRLMSSSSRAAPFLISPKQAQDLIVADRHVKLLDASWFMPNSSRKPQEEFLAKRIPGAQFFDLDKVSSLHELGLKHMMPEERVFADACEEFGIEPSSHVVLYDTSGIFSSPRALFTFRAFGHENSSVLNGGLPAWLAEDLPVDEKQPSIVTKSIYHTPRLDAKRIRSYEEIVENSRFDPLAHPDADLVLDARSRGRYFGVDPEPRPGLSSGHMPHSLSLPFNVFLEKHTCKDGTEYSTFLTPEGIRKALIDAVGPERAELILSGKMSVTTSCGSGMTAGILWLGLKLLGVEKISLYDESWTGYAMRSQSKIEKSES